MFKNLVICILITLSSYANDCSPYFNPNKFYDVPEYLADLIDTNLKSLKLFGNKTDYDSLSYTEIEKNFFINDFIKLNEYTFPKNSGLHSYKISNEKVDEFSISTVNVYRYSDIDIAEEINNDFEGYWSDWNEDGYEMQLVPEQVLMKYKEKYFSFSVYIYGVKGDTTRLKGTTIKYWFKDYTSQVNEHIECMK